MQQQRQVPAYLLGMIVLGTIGLSFVGWLFAHRNAQPLVTDPPAAISAEEHSGVQMLVVGAARAAGLAARQLADDARGKATHAMDAAERATALGMHTAQGGGQVAFERAHHAIKRGRHALQMGQPLAAATHFTDAAELLDEVRAEGNGDTPARTDWPAYEGAVVINASGLRIGELEEIAGSEGGSAEAILRTGGMQDFLGFIDLGGTELRVPAETLLYGKPKTLGSTMVAIPVLTSSGETE